MNETTLSENPSSRPTMKAFAPRTLIRKNGRIGRIISLLMSVNRDTTPRMSTFTVSPYARDRRVATGSPRGGEGTGTGGRDILPPTCGPPTNLFLNTQPRPDQRTRPQEK